MSYRPLIVATVGLGLAVLAPQALAQDQPPAMETMAAADIAWENIEVPGFRPGMQIAVFCTAISPFPTSHMRCG